MSFHGNVSSKTREQQAISIQWDTDRKMDAYYQRQTGKWWALNADYSDDSRSFISPFLENDLCFLLFYCIGRRNVDLSIFVILFQNQINQQR